MLENDEVALWRIDLESEAANDPQRLQALSQDEKERATRFRFAPDNRRFSVARSALRSILGACLHVEPASLSFRYTDKGKPYLDEKHLEGGLAFNVSHSGTLALIAVARGRELGVDVEQVREERDLEAIARRFFSVQEQQRLNALPLEERTLAFFRCWTRKEAYIKARGEGLSLPLAQFDVSISSGDQDALRATRPDAEEAYRWSLRDVPVDQGYAAAVAATGADWRLKQLTL